MNHRLTTDSTNIIWEFDNHSIRAIKRYCKNIIEPFYKGIYQIHETNNNEIGKLAYQKKPNKRWVRQ